MKVLVINCGSSSLKYQVLDMTDETLLAKGLVERIGMDGSVINHTKTGCDKVVMEVPMKDHKDAIAQVLAAVRCKEHGRNRCCRTQSCTRWRNVCRISSNYRVSYPGS